MSSTEQDRASIFDALLRELELEFHLWGLKFTDKPDLKTIQALAFLRDQAFFVLYPVSARMLYLADREALKQLGRTISDGHYISTQYGIMVGKRRRGLLNPYTVVLERINYNRDEEISETEEDILIGTWEKYSPLDPYDAESWMRECPEWQEVKDYPNRPVPLSLIAKHLGKLEDAASAAESGPFDLEQFTPSQAL